MRILYIHQHFRTPEEGGGQRPYEFSRRLAEMGHDVTVIRGRALAPAGETPGVRVVEAGGTYTNAMGFSSRLRSFADFALHATRAAWKLRADVVFASSTPLTVALPAIAAKHRHRIPMVFEVRDLWPEVPIALGYLRDPFSRFAARQLEKLAYANATAVIGLSPTMCRGVSAVAPDKPVHLIPNTSNTGRFRTEPTARVDARRRVGICEDAKVIVYAGSMGVTYDTTWLLETAAASGWEVYLLGEGTLTPTLRARAAALGLDPEAHVPGAVSHSAVVDYYAAADMVASSLIPSDALKDNSLNKVFDAFAAGRPLVFNHDGWLSELAVERGAGWRLSTTDIATNSTLLNGLNHSDLERAGRVAGEIGVEQFSTSVLVERLEMVLRQAVKP